MALTEAQNVTLFEILEVPYVADGQLWQLTDEGDRVMTGNNLNFYALQSAYTQIMTLISGYSGVSLDKLTGLLSSYDDLGNEDIEIVGGALGEGVNGVNYSSRSERENIARKVRIMIPCYRQHEQLQRQTPRGAIFVS